MPHILCVGDDPYQSDLLRYGFAREGFAVTTARTRQEALRLARTEPVDLIVLSIDASDATRHASLDALRTIARVPIVILSARLSDDAIIAAFDAGADDYVPTPFNMQILVARVTALLRPRRGDPQHPTPDKDTQTYRVAGARFEVAANRVTSRDGTGVSLTPMEGRLLLALATHPGEYLSVGYLMERLERDGASGLIRTHIRHLREKIASLPGGPQPIQSAPRLGYRLTRVERIPGHTVEMDTYPDRELAAAFA